MKSWFKSGQPWIWLNAGAVSMSLIMVFGLVMLIAVRGLSYFWPSDVISANYQQPSGETIHLIGEIESDEMVPRLQVEGSSGYNFSPDKVSIERYLLKVGNRDVTGVDFKVVFAEFLTDITTPDDIMVVERHEWGNFYGFLSKVKQNGEIIAEGEAAREALETLLERSTRLHDRIKEIQKDDIGAINYKLEQVRLDERELQLENDLTEEHKQEFAARREALNQEYEKLKAQMNDLYTQIRRDSMVAETDDGKEIEIPLAKVVRVFYPNEMGIVAKTGFYLSKVWEFVSDEPREANTEGGIFPAIFGTVMMVLIMSVLVTPFGVIAAIYLREYATQGPIIRTIRIAVNNLAGVPSIVYGVFGLGFFVYFLGGNIDQLFFPEALPAPTFGTPGILWASLTLALLTLPVVIVSTEEGLSRIPRSIREGSLALGATKAETLWRTVIPMASPAMMTGLILAVARAAGEVAPLMLVGVVKLAPSLPLDGNFPYLHMERKFMHLGFHIYDVGFQSPNVEAARPLVYATSLLLILVIIGLNLAAIHIRNHLREKYRALEGG
ncbi:MAG: phosphate ABC transporter permease PstA [Thiohalophilus sp.]